jgi:hypothetical protein
MRANNRNEFPSARALQSARSLSQVLKLPHANIGALDRRTFSEAAKKRADNARLGSSGQIQVGHTKEEDVRN